MTIDMIEATPETAHAALMAPGTTARGIAYSALAIAHSDIAKACTMIRDGAMPLEEIQQVIAECMNQMEFSQRMLNGTVWMM